MSGIADVFLFVSIALLAAGFFWKHNRCHLVRAAGWTVFGIFWWLQIPDYIAAVDVFNALASALALPAFMFFAYHEFLSYRWREEYQPLKFLAGATFLAAGIFFTVDRIPFLAGNLIQVVADHTVALLNALGGNYWTEGIHYPGGFSWYRVSAEEIYVPIREADIHIILACTAIQALAVAVSFIVSTEAKWKRRGIALGISIPVIYIMNLVRNVVVIHLYDVQSVSFELAHGSIGKIISLLTLVGLVVLLFEILPQFYDNIMGSFDLLWRKGPKHEPKDIYERLLKKKPT
ncbi:MAG: archaeosortase A [Thermoplasmata archaeon]|nr:archaeosortase A [Thermoplasmata archaeon]